MRTFFAIPDEPVAHDVTLAGTFRTAGQILNPTLKAVLPVS